MKQRITLAAGLVLALSAGTAPRTNAQTVFQNFTASTLFGPADEQGNIIASIPPDTGGAIGPDNQYAEFVNGTFAAYDTTSGSLKFHVTDSDFWSNGGANFGTAEVSDPRVIYDTGSQRWFTSGVTVPYDNVGNILPNQFLVGVSKTSNLADGFSTFALNANPAAGSQGLFADFDQLGINGDGVYVSANSFPAAYADKDDYGLPPGSTKPLADSAPSAPTGSPATSFLVIPKASLIAATPSTNGSSLIYNIDPNFTGFTAHPVIDQDETTGREYVLSDYVTPAGAIAMSSIDGPATSPDLNVNYPLTAVTAYNEPTLARQLGGDDSIDAGDNRFSSHVYEKNGELWAVQTVNIGGQPDSGGNIVGGHDALRWLRIDGSTQQVISEGLISDPNHDYYYGSIATNGQGNVVIGYTRSGPDEFASTYASVGTVAGANVLFNDPLLLKAGTISYDTRFGGDRNRWGDFSATTIDPNNPLNFWTIQEYASGYNTDYGYTTWSTQVTGIRVPNLAAVPEANSLLFLVGGASPLLAWTWRRRRNPA